jgi:transposase InsO family protein
MATSSRSASDKYRPNRGGDAAARCDGGIPPASRNHRTPTAGDTPLAIAASSLERPAAIAAQNCRRSSFRATEGRPGDRNLPRPDRCEHRPLRIVIATPSREVLRRPHESTQYLSIRYTERLAEAGMELSVGSVGDSYDNGLAESVIGLFKTEVIRRRGPWRGLEDVEFATLDWVSWYNTQRLLEPIGYVPPVEYENHYYRNHPTHAMVAGVN